MKIHHINAGTMCPIGGRLINGPPARLVCHCLLIESNDGLILVDTGIGTKDIESPTSRFPLFFRAIRPTLRIEETAIKQIESLGFKRGDVRHILTTHLDFDHAGGLSDFPEAKVHTFGPEFIAAMAPTTFMEKQRYRSALWSHKPDWVLYREQGETWNGFDCVRDLEGLPPEILIVPLAGHTLGHCGIAVELSQEDEKKYGKGWLLHAGDAYFYKDEVNSASCHCTFGLKVFQKFAQADSEMRHHNRDKLRDLVKNKGGNIHIFSAHDPTEFQDMRDKNPL